MRRFIPFGQFFGFVGIHFVLVWAWVPSQNLIPASLAAATLTAMTLCMVFATRLKVIDAFMEGPGRSYRLHRTLGYGAILPMIGHWVLARPRGVGVFPQWSQFAAQCGEIAAIVMVVLIIVSALRVIPYHWWKKSHYAMGPVYLLSIYHTFFSAIPIGTGSFLWWFLVLECTFGLIALVLIFMRHFKSPFHYIVAKVTLVKHGIDFRLIPINKKAIPPWQPGQFVSLWSNNPSLKESHPFTICSAPRGEEVRFLVGSRGDFTHNLQMKLEFGDEVFIRDVAGHFLPQSQPDRLVRQVWVAGGLGITPFLAAIDALRVDDGPQIDLFYCYRSLEWALDIENLIYHSDRLPQLRVHFIDEETYGFFSNKTLCEFLKDDWRDSELYVCGPDSFIDVVCDAWRKNDARGKIHVELFDFRAAWFPPEKWTMRSILKR